MDTGTSLITRGMLAPTPGTSLITRGMLTPIPREELIPISGIALITRGLMAPISGELIISGGGGGAGLRKEDDIVFPKIIVNKLKIGKHEDKSLDEGKGRLKVTPAKLILN